MKNQDYTVTIELLKPSSEVFRAITLDVAKWWGGNDLEGNTTKPNDEFIIDHPGAHYSKQKLIEVIPDTRLVWHVTDSKLDWLKNNQHEWTGTKMIFDIIDKGDKTILHFSHSGLTPDLECYERVSLGWDTVIKEWLFDFITTGKGHFSKY